MDNAKQHWEILQALGSDLANRVRSFMVVGRKGNGVIMATEDGEGYWLGTIKFGLGKTKTVTKPTLLLDVPAGLVQMAHNSKHIVFLNKQGEIYTMEMNGGRQLTNVEPGTRFPPQLIPIPQHIITSVRCSYWHSVALTENGKVWAWEWNNSNQFEVPFFSSPHQILKLDSHRVVAVECGDFHLLALTDQGDVYGWGMNHYGQLGDCNVNSIYSHTPTRISFPSSVQSMASGENHTLLLTQTGEVYACGKNGHGQLGLPISTKSSHRLSKIAGLPPISQIASNLATDLSIAMSFEQRCFVWGHLADGTSISTPWELPPFYSTVESPLSFYSTHRNTSHSILVPVTPPSLLYARMSQMFYNPETSDVQFLVEQRTIHAHRIILSNSSDYFVRMFSERWFASVDPEDPIVRVTIPDHSYQAFHAFLRFLYTDCLEVHPDLLPELFELATQYLVPDLKRFCLSKMRETLTPATCCLYYQFTLRYSLPELATFQQELVQFISTNYFEVFSTDAYQSMQKIDPFQMVNHSLKNHVCELLFEYKFF